MSSCEHLIIIKRLSSARTGIFSTLRGERVFRVKIDIAYTEFCCEGHGHVGITFVHFSFATFTFLLVPTELKSSETY